MFVAVIKKLLILSILLAITGGQWMLLQSAAWAGMIVSNLRHESVQIALSQTFDGKHPCPLCRAIESSKKSQPKSEALPKLARLEFPLTHCDFGLSAPSASTFELDSDKDCCDSLNIAPPLRPPRSTLVRNI